MVETSTKKVYTGIAIDVTGRVAKHNKGKGAKCLLGQLPVQLLWKSIPMTQSVALRLEYRIKQMPPGKKRQLAGGTLEVPYE
jgi:putative endonuclease